MSIHQTKCYIKECNVKKLSLGLCERHYGRLRRTGDPLGLKGGHSPRPAIICKDFIKIPLGINAKDGYAITDLEFLHLQELKWGKSPDGYAWTRTKEAQNTRMQHFIIGKPNKGLVTDHINRDRLDNRKSNLRHVTQRENTINSSVRYSSKSGYKGVSWDSKKSKWRASITTYGKFNHIGFFDSVEDAVKARVNYQY
jgi:hypothetical protein